LIKPSDLKRLLAVYGELPVSHQFIVMDRYPGDHHLVLLGRQISCQQFAVRDRVNRNAALEFCMNMRQLVFIGIEKEHPDQDAIEHRNCGHLRHPFCAPNVKAGPPPVVAPERSDGAATSGRAEAPVGLRRWFGDSSFYPDRTDSGIK
jgi:hypothetical protein